MSTILDRPDDARALLVLAHGAGAGMRHAFMQALAASVAARGVAVLRYQFPFTEAGRRRPDPAPRLEATVRAAITAGAAQALPLFAGGKSMGGRMTTAVAAAGLEGVRGLVLVGFPLHPPDKPSTSRATHLAHVKQPMLFLQGTRDALAPLRRLRPVLRRLPLATLEVVDGADHAFALPARRRGADVSVELADAIGRFVDRCLLA